MRSIGYGEAPGGGRCEARASCHNNDPHPQPLPTRRRGADRVRGVIVHQAHMKILYSRRNAVEAARAMNIVETKMLPADLLARFVAIVGEKNAITEREAQAPYLTEPRDMFRGKSPVVLRPGSVAEVSAILKLASETATAIVPQGGNTGLVGGQTPHHGEVVLSLKRLDRIREIDPTSNTMTCEAGVVLMKAQEAAAEVNRLFPLSLGAEG